MFKKSTTNKQLGLFTTASSLMCKRESKQYEDEKAWHMQFYRNVTCKTSTKMYSVHSLTRRWDVPRKPSANLLQ
ncbi:MAG: hypothetical protein MR717_12595 [Prevotella sp.]|nr:hypothetical protein [Prevotella sp.]